MTLAADHRHILVVDDDLVSRRYLQRSLEKIGYKVRLATGVREAQGLMNDTGFETFSCVLTDFRMPEHNGLELLEWLRQQAPDLATILVTAEGEKDLVTESLRGGACDFLDKPVESIRLRDSVSRAIQLTDRRRHLAATESAAIDVGRVQQIMLGPSDKKHHSRLEYLLHPKHQAGGDFINEFHLPSGQTVVLAADVSGHDLKAAFISSYFQGIVRGMIERQAPLRDILEFFNRFLVNEWNVSDPTAAASISVCGVLFDEQNQIATLFNSGFPSPLHVDASGEMAFIGEGSSPLGWFGDLTLQSRPLGSERGGYLYLWSDGLEDFALATGISPIAIAHRLLHTPEAAARNELLHQLSDDISLMRLNLNHSVSASDTIEPLLLEHYSGDRSREIDAFQVGWEKSLRFALPRLPEPKLYDLLLCLREAMLNAMQHGCAGQAEQFCRLQISLRAADNVVRAQVVDPGPGFKEDFLTRSNVEGDAFEHHCGLILIKSLPDRLTVKGGGSLITKDFAITMDFQLGESSPSQAHNAGQILKN